jgi:hypothetical protein
MDLLNPFSHCPEISNELPQRRELVSRPAAGHCWEVLLTRHR